MERDQDNERVLIREQLLDRYVLALDSGSLEEVATVLDTAYEAALDDPEIDRLITEINRSYRAEAGLTPLAVDADLVPKLLSKNVPSAFISHEHLKKPLTVGEVAGKLQTQGRVRPGDEEANRALLGNTAPLPKLLNAQEIKSLAVSLGVDASEFYWRAFRDAAITMGIARSHNQAQLAARERQLSRARRRGKKKQD